MEVNPHLQDDKDLLRQREKIIPLKKKKKVTCERHRYTKGITNLEQERTLN